MHEKLTHEIRHELFLTVKKKKVERDVVIFFLRRLKRTYVLMKIVKISKHD